MPDTANAPATPTFQPFTDDVWAGFAGAESFPDGAEPIFAEGRFTLGAQRAWILVLDATGGCLSIEGDPQSECGGYILGLPFATPAAAEAWFRKEVAAPAHLLDFLMAGFVRC